MLERSVADAAFGCVWDPMAVHACVEAGIGSRFGLRLGRKSDEASSQPLDAVVEVRGLEEHHFQTTPLARRWLPPPGCGSTASTS
jgi:microcystin degradation protein MlrC